MNKPPDLSPIHAVIFLSRAQGFLQRQQYARALADLTEYLRQQPGAVIALRARALNYARLHRFDEALADLNEILRLDPASADTWLDRGRAYQHQRRYPEALADYEKVLELAPGEARVHNQLSWMLAACPQSAYRDGPRAVELARRACELTGWQDPNLLDTLASAYAECGRFDEAVTWAKKALALPQTENEIKEAVQRHIELFQSGQPARFES